MNAFAFGSCNFLGEDWQRSKHSSIGFGRSPGRVRPELVALGGEEDRPYFVLGPSPNTAIPVVGTSFASPTAMRVAAGIRAYLGPVMGPLAIKALMINRSDPRGDRSLREVGWGRVVHSPEDLLTSDDSTAHIIYQDELEPAQWMRVPIPIPDGPLPGKLYITATFCYKTETDPEHPANYTRAGLQLKFRPNKDKKDDENRQDAKTCAIFSPRRMYGQTEQEWRFKSHEWETAIHCRYSPSGSALLQPAFDVHYNARMGGANAATAGKIPFALVVTIRSKQVPDLYNRVASQYRMQLQALQPIRIPLKISR